MGFIWASTSTQKSQDRNREKQPEPGFPSASHKACEARSWGQEETDMRSALQREALLQQSTGQATAVGRSVSAQRARDNLCVLRTPETSLPSAAFTSPGNESLLLCISIRFKGSKLTYTILNILEKILRKDFLPFRSREKAWQSWITCCNKQRLLFFLLVQKADLLAQRHRILIFKWASAFASRKGPVVRI